MKIILLKDVKGLGRAQELITVTNGYARNYLIPQRLARFADEKSLKNLELQQAQGQAREKKQQKLAQELIKRLPKIELEFVRPADEMGNLYAGLNEEEILAKIRESEASLPNNAHLMDYKPIKNLGSYKAKVRLSRGLETEINILVKIANDAKK